MTHSLQKAAAANIHYVTLPFIVFEDNRLSISRMVSWHASEYTCENVVPRRVA